MQQRTDLVGLLRVRANCCLFTWRAQGAAPGTRGTKTVEVDERHCPQCIDDLRSTVPGLHVVDRRSEAGRAGAPCRVLIIDDEVDVREELVTALRDMGCEVVAAGDGQQALAYLRSGAPLPRLILLDLMMPIMDGEEFLRHQGADQRIADIPVVVVTARPLDAPLSVSPFAVVRKPFRMETIGNIVERHRAPHPPSA